MNSPGQRLKVILATVVAFQVVALGLSTLLNLSVWLTTGIAAVAALTVGLVVVRRVGG